MSQKALSRKMIFVISARPATYIVSEEFPGGKWVHDDADNPIVCAVTSNRENMEKAMDELRAHRDEPDTYVVQSLPHHPADESAQNDMVESILDMVTENK